MVRRAWTVESRAEQDQCETSTVRRRLFLHVSPVSIGICMAYCQAFRRRTEATTRPRCCVVSSNGSASGWTSVMLSTRSLLWLQTVDVGAGRAGAVRAMMTLHPAVGCPTVLSNSDLLGLGLSQRKLRPNLNTAPCLSQPAVRHCACGAQTSGTSRAREREVGGRDLYLAEMQAKRLPCATHTRQ